MENKKIVVKNTNKPELTSNKVTLREKVADLARQYLDDESKRAQFVVAILELINRVVHPEYYCPECDEKMFFEQDEGIFSCINCGYKSEPNIEVTPKSPNIRRSGGKIPDNIEKVIQQAEQGKELDIPRRQVVPSARGEKIRKLAEKISGGSTPPNKLDEAMVKQDPNVKDVNWV